MIISAGVLGIIAWLILWLALGHFWLGVIVGLIIWAVGGGIGYSGRNRL